MRTHEKQKATAKHNALHNIAQARGKIQKAIDELYNMTAFEFLIDGAESPETHKAIKQLFDIESLLFKTYKAISEGE